MGGLSILALLLGLLLTGCVEDSALSPDAQFDRAAAVSAGTGLIVMGIRVSREPEGDDWLLGLYSVNPVYTLGFARIGADGRLARPWRTLQICETERMILNGALSSCDPGLMRYRAISVPAGRYLLVYFLYQSHEGTIASNYIDPDTRSRFGPYVAGFGDRISHPERSFTVGAGEIVYIGDMSFDASHPFAMINLSRNDIAAEAAMNEPPDIGGAMVFRSVAGASP